MSVSTSSFHKTWQRIFSKCVTKDTCARKSRLFLRSSPLFRRLVKDHPDSLQQCNLAYRTLGFGWHPTLQQPAQLGQSKCQSNFPPRCGSLPRETLQLSVPMVNGDRNSFLISVKEGALKLTQRLQQLLQALLWSLLKGAGFTSGIFNWTRWASLLLVNCRRANWKQKFCLPTLLDQLSSPVWTCYDQGFAPSLLCRSASKSTRLQQQGPCWLSLYHFLGGLLAIWDLPPILATAVYY